MGRFLNNVTCLDIYMSYKNLYGMKEFVFVFGGSLGAEVEKFALASML